MIGNVSQITRDILFKLSLLNDNLYTYFTQRVYMKAQSVIKYFHNWIYVTSFVRDYNYLVYHL
jgi:hypothetical protein